MCLDFGDPKCPPRNMRKAVEEAAASMLVLFVALIVAGELGMRFTDHPLFASYGAVRHRVALRLCGGKIGALDERIRDMDAELERRSAELEAAGEEVRLWRAAAERDEKNLGGLAGAIRRQEEKTARLDEVRAVRSDLLGLREGLHGLYRDLKVRLARHESRSLFP